MNPLEDQILELLNVLKRHRALDHLMLIGSWTTLFYQDYFDDQDYHPIIRTTDIDFLVPKRPPKDLNLDIAAILQRLGFLLDHSPDGWVTFQKPDLHIEFLWQRLGQQSDQAKTIPELGITVRPLRFMWLLTHYPIRCAYQGIRLNVAHPAAFAIHKLIISARRTKPLKRENDRQQAEAVLSFLKRPKDMVIFREIMARLSKNENRAVSNAIHGRVTLEALVRHLNSLE